MSIVTISDVVRRLTAKVTAVILRFEPRPATIDPDRPIQEGPAEIIPFPSKEKS